jgi:hypothetical protein
VRDPTQTNTTDKKGAQEFQEEDGKPEWQRALAPSGVKECDAVSAT